MPGPTTRWIMGALNSERALTKAEMLRELGGHERTLARCLAELIRCGEVVRFCTDSPDHGQAPAVYIRRYDDALVRVPEDELWRRAKPAMDRAWTDFVMRRNSYTARQIKRRKAREQREEREARERRSRRRRNG